MDGSSKADEQARLYQPRKSFPTDLKEASPPKTNPWGKIKPLSPKPLSPGMPSPEKQSPKQPSPKTPSCSKHQSPKQQSPKRQSPKSDNSPGSSDHDVTPRAGYASLAEQRVSPTPSPQKDSRQKGKAPATFEEQRSHSASPSSSRAVFQAAAPRAGERHAHCVHLRRVPTDR